MLPFLALVSLFTLAKAVSQATPYGSCIGTISSLSDVSAAVQCTTVNINAFTVPSGVALSLDLLQDTIVNVLGEIQFGNKSWSGPLFEVKGTNITFNGNGHIWDGGGPFYWDGLGSNGGVTKPCPMMRFEISGMLSNVHVVNSPARSLSIHNDGPLVVSDINIDNSQGDCPNTKSAGLPAGHNTDGFDVSGNDLVIKNSVVLNQDDCLAINRGQNIIFEDNYCENGHGISIGSITSDVVVENVIVRGNTVVNSRQAFRIKTDQAATNSRVTNVTYSHNTAANCTSYGLMITQSYPSNFDTPGTGVLISDINFNLGTTDISVTGDAETVAVNCGNCGGHWDWSDLNTSGGDIGPITNKPDITGYTM